MHKDLLKISRSLILVGYQSEARIGLSIGSGSGSCRPRLAAFLLSRALCPFWRGVGCVKMADVSLYHVLVVILRRCDVVLIAESVCKA